MIGAKLFCLLDLTGAYTHLTVDEAFSHALTLNTPKHGLIRPKRVVYGVANIPAVWHRIEEVLRDIENVFVFFDDILLFGKNFDTLVITLEKVLHRLK